MQRIYIIILLIVAALITVEPVCSQPGQLSDEAVISMTTIFPGDATEELFGHSAIRVQDSQLNIDFFFNYGTFQFDNYFLPKFIYGDLNYFLSVVRTSRALQYYEERRRPVVEQVLNLTTDQKRQIYQFLRLNTLEENRYYQYDFLFDNCSTRIRDGFENVLGEDLRFAPNPDPGLTYRQMIDLYVNHRPGINLGIDLLLGSRIDRVALPHEAMFLPDFLMEAFDHATIIIDGEEIPLVAYTSTLLEIEDYKTAESLPWAAIATWLLFVAGVVITSKNVKNGESAERWFDTLLFAVCGLIGLLITFLWFISLHNVTASNLNLFWAWPFHLLILPALFKNRNRGNTLRIYFLLSAISCFVILIGWMYWAQSLHAAVLPVLLLLTIRSGWIALNKASIARENG
jgi:hypothetical protein